MFMIATQQTSNTDSHTHTHTCTEQSMKFKFMANFQLVLITLINKPELDFQSKKQTSRIVDPMKKTKKTTPVNLHKTVRINLSKCQS